MKNLMEAAVQPNKSHHTPLGPYICTCQCSLQGIIGLVPNCWSPWHVRCWTLSRTPPGHPAARMSCRDLQLLTYGSVTSSAPADHRWGRQLVALGLGLGSCRVGLPDGKWGQLSHGHSFGTGSLTPALTVVAQLCCSGEMQDLLSQVSQLVGTRDGSSTLKTTEPSLPPASSIGGWGCTSLPHILP